VALKGDAKAVLVSVPVPGAGAGRGTGAPSTGKLGPPPQASNAVVLNSSANACKAPVRMCFFTDVSYR
jgi:hypothetical protein